MSQSEALQALIVACESEAGLTEAVEVCKELQSPSWPWRSATRKRKRKPKRKLDP